MNWDEGQIKEIDERKVRVKGVSCIWKTSTIDPDFRKNRPFMISDDSQ